MKTARKIGNSDLETYTFANEELKDLRLHVTYTFAHTAFQAIYKPLSTINTNAIFMVLNGCLKIPACTKFTFT